MLTIYIRLESTFYTMLLLRNLQIKLMSILPLKVKVTIIYYYIIDHSSRCAVRNKDDMYYNTTVVNYVLL